MIVKICTGTYNCADFKVIKTYTRRSAAVSFLKSIGYTYGDLLIPQTWTKQGTKYTLTLSK